MGARKATLDLVAILEAAYRVDSSTWLTDVMDAAAPSYDRGRGMCAFFYDASKPGVLSVGDVVERGCSAPVTASGMGRSILSSVDASFVNSTYRSKICATASEEPVFQGFPSAYLRPFGIGDVQVVNALDSTGKGLVMCSYLPKLTRLTDKDRATWTRVAAHLASAYRLRRRTRSRTAARLEATDTVLTTKGTMEHAGPDAESARTELRRAVVEYGRAKGTLRDDPQASLDAWQVLVDRRWSLLDSFEKGGARYVIARRNDAPAKGPRTLTKRERQVLAYAAIGHENKLIAYSLGVSHATVRVLIARAAEKFGVRTRVALLSAFLQAEEGAEKD
jgi:DNA-binding CsgD family transcriptional regulator